MAESGTSPARKTPITDHRHEYEMRGRWRTGKCAICDQAVNAHLSYGQDIAAKIGGEPLEYVTADSADFGILLGSIDNALRNGSQMTNANLAFMLLCERLGIARDGLRFDNHEVHEVFARMHGEVSLRG